MTPVDPNAATLPPTPDPFGATLPPSDSPAVPPADGPPPVPGYEIVRELGRGGMGVVYLARQVKLNRLVALKMVLAGGHASEQTKQRFLVEAEAVGAVQHPHVVQVYDYGTHDDRPFFALEFCPGGSLKDKLAGTPMTAKPAAELVAKVAAGVQAAHAVNLIHRDLKPDNVLFAADGTPKVTDFGLARRFDTDSNLTATGAIMGTPSYMAPEQAAAKKDIGPPADVYALGAILYECLTGRPPFRAATALDTILQVVNEEPVAPRTLVPNLPRDIETIALKCLQKEPGKRYPSADAMAADLGRFVAGEAITARPLNYVEKTWKKVKRRPLLYAMYLLLCISIGVTIGVISGSNRALRNKQAALETETAAAKAAHADADAQRVKAHARLQKGVEAVEKLTGRLNGREWSRNPVLAAERKRILDDVTAFYQSFDEADAADPLIRRETARALHKVGSVSLSLAEFDKAAAAFDRSRTLFATLADEFPADADYRIEQAQAEFMLGNTTASRGGRYSQAVEPYRRALAAARQAVATADTPAAQRTLIECLTSLGYFNMFGDRAESAKLFAEAADRADILLADPAAAFESRVLAAYSRVSLTALLFSQNKPAEGGQHLAKAGRILGPITPDPTAPVRYQDIYDQTKAIMKLFNGGRLFGEAIPFRGKPEFAAKMAAAVAEMEAALAGFNALIAAYPKLFPYRMYRLQTLLSLTRIHGLADQMDLRAKRRAEAFAEEDAILAVAPEQRMVREITAPVRARALAEQAQEGDFAGLDATADRLLALANGNEIDHLLMRYNIACALSLGSAAGPADVRVTRADRAMRILTAFLDTPLFADPRYLQMMLTDNDLKPLDGRADYQAFVEKAKAVGKK